MQDRLFPIISSFCVILAIWLGILGPAPEGVSKWIYDWQTLLSAMIALAAAYFAVHISQRQESHRRQRKLESIRATLPFDLDQLNEYGKQSTKHLNNLLVHCSSGHLPQKLSNQSSIPALPKSSIEDLAALIEYADDLSTNVVQNLVAWIQIHDARIRDLVATNQKQTVTEHTIAGYVLDAVVVYSTASAIFDYARRRSTQLPLNVTWNQVETDLNILMINHSRVDTVLKLRQQSLQFPFDALTRG